MQTSNTIKELSKKEKGKQKQLRAAGTIREEMQFKKHSSILNNEKTAIE